MTDSLWWDTARAGGLVAAALLAASVIAGLAVSTAPRRARPRPAWRLDLHRFLGGLACIFLVVHLGGIYFDRFVTFRVVDLVVPLTAHWHPWAVALGVVAVYLLVAVEVTSLLKPRLPIQVWRNVHHASFPLFALVQLHVLLAGTDRHSPLLLGTIV
ncbi:MAG TPA: ferric reductase-like transmembrane domain-containing protein, partial [Acidimicrobiales bacterium]|nr:ferric reductase-like transmembrane domain-containing protein [Acidimicrobiales bacterium]